MNAVMSCFDLVGILACGPVFNATTRRARAHKHCAAQITGAALPPLLGLPSDGKGPLYFVGFLIDKVNPREIWWRRF